MTITISIAPSFRAGSMIGAIYPPENLKKFSNCKINFFKFSGGIRSYYSTPALTRLAAKREDGAIDPITLFYS